MLLDRPSITQTSAMINTTVESGDADPSNPHAGELFFNTDLGVLRVYNGGAWGSLPAVISGSLNLGSGNLTTTGTITGVGSGLTGLNASSLSSGTVPTARLGSGTANSTTFLRGDQTWVTVGGGSVSSVGIIGSSGIGVSGSPITTAGDITLSLGAITPTSISTGNIVTSAASVMALGDAGTYQTRYATTGYTPTLQKLGTTIQAASSLHAYYANTSSGNFLFMGKSRAATIGAHSAVQSGDELGGLSIAGSDGAAFTEAGRIRVVATAAATSDSISGRLELMTTNAGTTPAVGLTVQPTRQVTMPANIVSSSTTTGTLVVTGGVGISERLNVGDMLTVNHNVFSSRTASEAYFVVQRTTGFDGGLLLRTTGTNRWALIVNADTEAGANAGSNFRLNRYDDAGTLIGAALAVARATGDATFSGAVSAASFSGSGAALTSLNASNLSSGTVGTARLGTGTANSTTFLRGDQTWQTIPAGSVTSVNVAGGTTGLTTSGGPITTSGTITLGGTLAVAHGGTGATAAPAARTNLGATTVGGSFFTLTNPSAVTFPRINADNTVTARSAADFRADIGAGVGSVTSVTVNTSGSGITGSGTITSSGTVTITSNATAANTASTLVFRDGSGNFSAGTITAALSGTASTAAAPSISFAADTDTGMFRSAENVIGWATGGTERLTLNGSGDLTATGNVTAYSDARLKKDVRTIEGALDKVASMRGVTYTDGSGRASTGVIAQEMLAVMPEVVQENEGGMYSVAYGNLVGVLIEAIKELRAEVADLRARQGG